MVKKISIVLLSALLVCPVFAQGFERSMKQNTQSWTNNQQLLERDGVIGQSDVVKADPKVPVGDTAWVLILGLGLAYGAYVVSRQAKKQH
ncbi:hypothetical protein M2138_000734 [Dysgonomonadaceae bacterium PH5-43]|nr:hypothetical protein [Dysgonomonadaceae bacterium PH5-43]